MRKFILAIALPALLSISAHATDMRDLNTAAAKMFVYGAKCEPLSSSLSEMVQLMLQSMRDAERTQAIAAATVLAHLQAPQLPH